MVRIVRCNCGLVVRVGERVSTSSPLCPYCHRPLAAAEAVVPPPQAVQVKPYYALEQNSSLGYQVVEVKAPEPESSAPDKFRAEPYPVAPALANSRWLESDGRDADIRAILSRARQELADER